jgi:hypothetical protein
MNFQTVKIVTSTRISVTQLLKKVISFTHLPDHIAYYSFAQPAPIHWESKNELFIPAEKFILNI